MATFFVPHAKDDEEAARVYAAIKEFAAETTGWAIGDRRIFRIEYVHEGGRYVAEVGREEDRGHETCFAILDSTTYLVCTLNRGLLRGAPLRVGKNEVLRLHDFDA
jgi:hypothetical protein